MVNINDKQFALYSSLFKGRTDIYARHWEKDGKSGYSPAYNFNWNEFLTHKSRGGTMANFENKKLIPLTPDVIRKHLIGQHVIGIYPLLEDNSSYFIVADFDGAAAFKEAEKLIETCREYGLPCYLERSRSGVGAHVWLFFEQVYPAAKSRVIILQLIRQALGLSDFDKEVSFDRLFPNQDFQSGKGFGNLIALPLQGISVNQNNTVFVDPQSLIPCRDQWNFLAQIQRMSAQTLDYLFDQLIGNSQLETTDRIDKRDNKLILRLNAGIHVKKALLNKTIINFVRDELNFPNLDYWLKKRLGKSVYQTEKFFKLIEENNEEIILPRGFLNALTDFLRTQEIFFKVQDDRVILPEVNYSSNIQLQNEQEEAVLQATEVNQGVIVAPPGSGKTIIGLELIARHRQPALILTHRKQIMDQWIERIQTFLGIPKAHIGRLDGVKKKIGQTVTVAMLQSLARKEDLKDLRDKFGLVIIDECHHIPAKTFREVVSGFNARYWYGLTATPKRKHNNEKLIYLFIGDIITELLENNKIEELTKPSKIIKPIIEREV